MKGKIEVYTMIERQVRHGPWKVQLFFEPDHGMGADYTFDLPKVTTEKDVTAMVERRKTAIIEKYRRTGEW